MIPGRLLLPLLAAMVRFRVSLLVDFDDCLDLSCAPPPSLWCDPGCHSWMIGDDSRTSVAAIPHCYGAIPGGHFCVIGDDSRTAVAASPRSYGAIPGVTSG